MRSILWKIYTQDKDNLIKDILYDYEHNQFAIVNFVYFSLIVAHQLFSDSSEKINIQKNYKKALLKADYLLPDGIALQIFYYLARIFGKVSWWRKWLPNLNGTDFVPYFLDYIKKKNGPQSLCVALYGTKDVYLEKTVEYLKSQGYNVVYYQDGFSEFQWGNLQEKLDEYQDTINLLLVGISTPTHPIQELWAAKNHTKIKHNNLIVMNVGGLLDFWAGVQKRAPLWLRKIKLEWLYRLITNPKRNIRKVINTFSLFPYIFRYLLLKK